jgi:hypothetical protein
MKHNEYCVTMVNLIPGFIILSRKKVNILNYLKTLNTNTVLFCILTDRVMAAF